LRDSGNGGTVDLHGFDDVRLEIGSGGLGRKITIRNREYTVEQLAYIWNWGDSKAEITSLSISSVFKSAQNTPHNLFIAKSLITDLHSVLYVNRRFSEEGLSEGAGSEAFVQFIDWASRFIDAIIVRLDELHIFEAGRPIAHVISDVIACIKIVRDKATKGDNDSGLLNDLTEQRKGYWQTIFRRFSLNFPLTVIRKSRQRSLGLLGCQSLVRILELLVRSSRGYIQGSKKFASPGSAQCV
jgi:hypothetical protein